MGTVLAGVVVPNVSCEHKWAEQYEEDRWGGTPRRAGRQFCEHCLAVCRRNHEGRIIEYTAPVSYGGPQTI